MPQDGGSGAAADDAARGEALLAQARAHLEAGRYQSAARAYADALVLLPGNQEAINGQAAAEALINQGSTIGQTEETARILREEAEAAFRSAMTRSAELLAQEDFQGARNVALTAKVRLNQKSSLFTASRFTAMYSEAESMLVNIEESEELARQVSTEVQRQEAESQRVAQERQAEARRLRDIEQKLRRVRQLQLELKYDEALQVVNEILFLDPHHPAALTLKDVIEVNRIFQRQNGYERRKEMSYSQLSLENQERLIAPGRNLSGPGMRGLSELMQYPEDWAQLSINRYNESGFHDSAENRAVLNKLNMVSVPVDFQDNSFEQVVSFVEQVTGLKIYVDWKSLDQVGVAKEAEVTLRLDEVPVGLALERVLEQLGDGFDDTTRPHYAIQDGILTIASDEALRRKTVTVVYDIRDLLFEVPYFDNAPELDLNSALQQGNQGGSGGGGSGGGGGGFGGGSGGGGSGGGGSGGGGGSIFGSGGGADPERIPREELVRQITDIIQENIDTEGWVDFGGDTGRIQELNGNLIITNTPSNHRQIEGLLSQLREIRALQINIETRVLTVSTDWFEQIGVDLDLYFNTNSDLYQQARDVDPLAQLGDFFDDTGRLKDPLIYGNLNDTTPNATGGVDLNPPVNGIAWGNNFGAPTGPGGTTQFVSGPTGAPIRATDGFTPIGVNNFSLDLLDAIGAATDFGKTVLGANPALVTGFQFLDDIQVDLLIEATQADQRSVILTAPRLTFFNGQRAWIAIQLQEAYVSGLQAVAGDNSGAFQPIISTLSSGFVLDVEAAISADRRYVTMTVIFDQSEVIEFKETAFTGAAGGGGGGGIGGGTAANFEGTVQLPVIQVGQVRTTVSVPDKGTVLLGGQRTTEEIEVETGVPVLSKIPFINRFFTNRMTSKAEQTLLILIRPEIIIQQENEDILFPGLSDTLGAGASYMR